MKILMATHPTLKPAKGRKGSESDVFRALLRLGHEVDLVGFDQKGGEFDRALAQFKPDLVFNLLEEFAGEAIYDFHLVSRLESLQIAFTGTNPRGLALSRNKFAALQMGHAVGLEVPKSWLLTSAKLPNDLSYPIFAKFNREHSSMGIRESSRCANLSALRATLKRLKRDYDLEVLLQEFISGQEVSLSLWGNERPETFAPRKLAMKGRTQIATEKVKFNADFQKERAIRRGDEKAMPEQTRKLCLELYRVLDLSGYARFDFRKTADGKFYLIDVNANPSLSKDEDFMLSAKRAGHTYDDVIARILEFGRAYTPTR